MRRAWQRSAAQRAAGFSFVEVLIALAIFAIVMGIVLTFFASVSSEVASEENSLQAQQIGRIVLDDITRKVRQAGFGIARDDPTNPATWQEDIVHAGPHVLAFNADFDEGVGSLAVGETITFPGGDTYDGEGPPTAPLGAETIVLTIDANDDGTIDLADRNPIVAGIFNPAGDTETPYDFAVFEAVFGWTGADYGGTLEPLGGNLFTNAVDSDETRFADGTSPSPLFKYVLTEDLDGDGQLDDSECVVEPCPPAAARAPQTYVWGDTDFSGTLSEAEKEALRTLPVGATGWAGNKLVSAGSYLSTQLSADVIGNDDVFLVPVDDVTGFGPGQYVTVGSGATAESFIVDDVIGSSLLMFSNVPGVHVAGEDVEIQPRTLRRAIRAVEIQYDAVTPATVERRPGTSGRRGRVLGGADTTEYQVLPLLRKVELLNITTTALRNAAPPPPTVPDCPVTVEPWCLSTDATITTLTAIVGDEPVDVSFRVTNAGGQPLGNADVRVGGVDPALGSVVPAQVRTNGLGIATFEYTPRGDAGLDALTAVATCRAVDGTTQDSTPAADLDLRLVKLSVSPVTDCLGTWTAAAGMAPPGTDYTVELIGDVNAAAPADVTLSLEFSRVEPDRPADFTRVQGELFVGAASQGTTAVDGTFTPVTATFDGNDQVLGAVRLSEDLDKAGVRLFLRATVADDGCFVGGSSGAAIDFHRLELGDANGADPACTPALPCVIADGAAAPQVVATLTRNGHPVEGATVKFQATKVSGPVTAFPSLSPANGEATTNGAGEAIIEVLPNEDPAISAASPLVVEVSTVAAETTGDPDECDASSIVSQLPNVGYEFHGTVAPRCGIDMPASGVEDDGRDTICAHVENIGICDVRILGVGVTYFTPNAADVDPGAVTAMDEGVVDALIVSSLIEPDTAYEIDEIRGGSVDTATDCDDIDSVTLFHDDCNNDDPLPNGQLWTFIDTVDCDLPPEPPNPIPLGSYFVLDEILLTDDLADVRLLRFTVSYQCIDCTTEDVQTATFTFLMPEP